ncbi:MAG: hypothetical protein H6Q19_620 [Bacteroidetes bacterium]|nr:hypothetical protein [Bacteroidota bacterium]
MIEKYYLYNSKLASGAQPSEVQFAELKEQGFEAIVNLSPASTRNALTNEASVIEKTGMYYIHFPVDCSNLKKFQYTTFEGIMNGLKDKKVFVHCGGNIKSSNLIHMYDVLANHQDEKKSLQTLYNIQQPEDKWFEYFKLMGMEGSR